MIFAIARNNSGSISATSMPQHFIFFYKSVAFFFERSIELAHQASYSCFGNETGITCSNVKRCIGSAETNAVCTWSQSTTRKEMTMAAKKKAKKKTA